MTIALGGMMASNKKKNRNYFKEKKGGKFGGR